MKYVIKTLVLLVLFVCSINTYAVGEVKQVGNTFVQTTANTNSNDTKTKYTYQTSKGDKYVIYLSKKGKAYIVRTSKSGKQYKQYLPEVTKKLGSDSHQTVIYPLQTQRQLNTSCRPKTALQSCYTQKQLQCPIRGRRKQRYTSASFALYCEFLCFYSCTLRLIYSLLTRQMFNV